MKPTAKTSKAKAQATPDRNVRADAQRNLDALLDAAKAVFSTAGVNAPVREIATRAGVGVATFYRHFPLRSDLVAAVFRREVDACAATSHQFAREHEPAEALARWLRRYTSFIVTKRGLAAALHSGDPAFNSLPAYFQQNLEPALAALLDAAVQAGQIRNDIKPSALLRAVANLSIATDDDDGALNSKRMVDLLIDGLRYGAPKAGSALKRQRNSR